MALIDDWESRQNGDQRYDDRWFSELLKLHHSYEELQKIFRFSPKSGLAVDRLAAFFEDSTEDLYWHPDSKNRPDISELRSTARAMTSESASFLRENKNDDIASALQSISEFRDIDSKQIQSYSRDVNSFNYLYIETIEDALRQDIDDPFFLTFPLKESIYILTSDFDASRYLSSPLTGRSRGFEAAYSFWKGGGVYCFDHDVCLIASRWK